jgi:hypothetical protein
VVTLVTAILVLTSGSQLTALEGVTSVVAFGVSVGAAGGRLVLGVRTGPSILYLRIFERAPAPPPGARGEAARATAVRAIAAALAVAAGLLLAAAVLLALTLTLVGEPQSRLFDHLPQLSALVAAGWMLVVGVVARRVAVWFARWEQRRGKVLVCPRLHSGSLRPVYYAAARAGASPELAAPTL